MAVGFAAAGNHVESASEAALAWTILRLQGDGAGADALADDLPPTGVTTAGDAAWLDVQRRTHDLARELQGHFVSEGQFAAASLYEDVAIALHGRTPRLRDWS